MVNITSDKDRNPIMDINHNLLVEIDKHLLEDEQPSHYFNKISETAIFSQFPLDMLKRLKETEQSPKHHPEGNVWNHTMLVLDEAAQVKGRSRDKRVFMWAALLHDIGKPDTTKIRKGRITSYDHDKAGAVLSGKFLMQLTDDKSFIDKVSKLIRWHMQILFVVNHLPFADVETMKKETDLNEVALLGLCDRLGRLNVDRKEEENYIKEFLQKVLPLSDK
jgi:putative nucleotidyltransferase with HDIG domain